MILFRILSIHISIAPAVCQALGCHRTRQVHATVGRPAISQVESFINAQASDREVTEGGEGFIWDGQKRTLPRGQRRGEKDICEYERPSLG